MDEGDDHEAVQGLLDFAHRASARSASQELPAPRRSGGRASTSGRDAVGTVTTVQLPVPPPAAAIGRLVTSGSTPPPGAKRPRPAARLFKDPDLKADPAPPAPPSAFSLFGSGDSGKSSAEFTTAFAAPAAREPASGSDAETESDEQGKQPPKRRRLTREVSLNTVLARVGSKEPPLADALGAAPQTVQELIPPAPLSTAPPGRREPSADTLQLVGRLWGGAPGGPSLPRPAGGPGHTLRPASSLERDLHLLPPPRLVLGSPPGAAAAAASEAPAAAAAPGCKEGEAAARTALWRGRVKHRLRTAEGASEVELFSLQALVPERLLEQMPPTLFVSTLAARANVRLGKHWLARCSLDGLSERQAAKVATLAAMRLVAVCELQHCTLSLVPFTDRGGGLRLVGFMIAG